MNERVRAKELAGKLLETASQQNASVLEFGMACEIAMKRLETRLSLTPVHELDSDSKTAFDEVEE